jgi:hypothetical protein
MSLFRFQRQRQLMTSFASTVLLLLCCVVAPDVDAASASIEASVSVSGGASQQQQLQQQQQQQHRRLNNQRIDCPVGVAYCDDPFDILDDPTVACDQETCAWLVTLLDPVSKPVICRSIQLVGDGDVPDFLEPCLWWERLYGGLKPTPAPSSSLEPTQSPTSGE